MACLKRKKGSIGISWISLEKIDRIHN